MEIIQFTGKHRFLNLAQRKQIRSLLNTIAKKNTKAIQSLQYVFVDDHELHQINLNFLKHDTLTDIITFDLGTTSSTIDGEIYISLDRVKENSATLNTLYFEELIRVISHGLLHLIGFKDKTSKDVATMRSKEEECLSLWRSIQ
ncbi:MAG: rRNA maturation RNase YbeY [Flavobacteriales bacterium]|nr:MAG: rRNA maturation RNase YbeY [Flavobacteriales bacterium]